MSYGVYELFGAIMIIRSCLRIIAIMSYCL